MALEYPEITHITKQMQDLLTGHKIMDISLSDSCNNLIKWGFVNLHKKDVVGLNITDITSWGQHIYIKFENDLNLVFGHMVGKLLYSNSLSAVPQKYKILFSLSDNSYFSYHTSLYGYACVLSAEEIINHKYVSKQGTEPLSRDFTYTYFDEMLQQNKKKPVKKIQSTYDYLAGYQNGYFQDIFYESAILPTRKISSLSEEEKHILYDSIIAITRSATENGGSTTEVDLFNKPGNYRRKIGNHLKNKPCPKCGTPVTMKNLLGSNSFYCQNCQH